MKKDLSSYLSSYSGHYELRAHTNTGNNITFLNGNLLTNMKNEISGYSVRVYSGGAWGFASSPDEKDILESFQKAKANSEFLSAKKKAKGANLFQKPIQIHKDLSTKKNKKTRNELVDFMKELDAYISSKYKDLVSRRLILASLDMEKSLLTSSGTDSYQMIPRAHIHAFLSLERDNAAIELKEVFGGLGQVEDQFSKPELLYEGIENLYKKLRDKKDGVYAKSGIQECILSSDLAGILAHEAVGHTTEADLVLGGSIAGEKMGKEVASPLVSLVDFAHSYEGNICPVPVYVDDEGTPSEDCKIIEKGVLKRLMHNKETAEHFSTEPQGNARAFQFFDEPLIRMRNTAVLPGNSSLEEMISSVDDGYLLSNSGNGQADSTGEFMFAVNMGYEIKKGKLGKAIQSTSISGIAFEMLKTVTMVSNEMHWENSGFCGKKQSMSVGMGGPALKCRVNIGGK